jgi:hypothetical protein
MVDREAMEPALRITVQGKIPAIVMDGTSCSYSQMTPLGHLPLIYISFIKINDNIS